MTSSCLFQVVRLFPAVSVGTDEFLCYPQICLGVLSPAKVVSLPSGVTEVSPSATILKLELCVKWAMTEKFRGTSWETNGHCLQIAVP